MGFLRQHWYDLGAAVAPAVLIGLAVAPPDATLTLILWLNLAALCLHQLEEYRFPGKFPGLINETIFKSEHPERYPLNANTSLIINVALGWSVYLLAAIFWNPAPWIAIGAVLVSFGNFAAHTTFFNVKGRTFYNPGMATAVVLFLPLVVWFFIEFHASGVASGFDWALGIAFGIALNVFGIVKLSDWLARPDSPFAFPPRNL